MESGGADAGELSSPVHPEIPQEEVRSAQLLQAHVNPDAPAVSACHPSIRGVKASVQTSGVSRAVFM